MVLMVLMLMIQLSLICTSISLPNDCQGFIPISPSTSQFDVGLVYDEPGHAIIHKWLLLTDPDDVTSEAKVKSM